MPAVPISFEREPSEDGMLVMLPASNGAPSAKTVAASEAAVDKLYSNPQSVPVVERVVGEAEELESIFDELEEATSTCDFELLVKTLTAVKKFNKEAHFE